MVKTESINSVDYKNLSIEEQAYRLIYHYVLNSRPHIYAILRDIGSDAIDDFVSYAYEYILIHISRYDNNRSNISTFIYNTLDYLYPIFICQTKYQISFNTARAMAGNNSSRITPEQKERLISFYDYTKQLSVDGSSVSLMPNDEDNNELPDLNLADPNANVEDIVLNSEIYENKILEVFYDEIDKYINRTKSLRDNEDIKRRNKDIILRMALKQDKSDTLQTIADDYNITRERVRQIYKKFCIWAQKNNNLRNVLGLGRYKPEVKRRRNG